MYINKSGYDRHHKFWGIGSLLYEYYFELSGETFIGSLRAINREAAKRLVEKHYPSATFKFKYNTKDKWLRP
jgi:hypothetical protein